MNDTDITDEVRQTLDSLKAWLAARPIKDESQTLSLSPPDSFKTMGFTNLQIDSMNLQYLDQVTDCTDPKTDKLAGWTDLCHLVTWSSAFETSVMQNKSELVVLELIRGMNEVPIGWARFIVEEAIAVIGSAINFEVGCDLKHPDTRGNNYAVRNILVDESSTLRDIVQLVFTSLYSKCVVRLMVKTSQYSTALLVAYLVELMHKAGATEQEVQCSAFDRRESEATERLTKCAPAYKGSRLSTIAAVFKQTDTFAASQSIIESYFRELYPNLIVLVEESVYERFTKDWQRYYSHAVHIGSRLDDRTTVLGSLNSKLQIDLAAIDIRASHKMAGHAINVLRFRTLQELLTLLGHLRKVPHMSVWNDDIILSREFCLRTNQCNEFWLNHVPRSLAGRRLPEEMLLDYGHIVAEDMTEVFNAINGQFADELDQLRKAHAAFHKKNSRLTTKLVIDAFISLLVKCKSLKNGATLEESLVRLKRFQSGSLHRMNVIEGANPTQSRIEIILKPVGTAILFVREEIPAKTKPILVEMIFKNLLLGNAVLLVCPANTLGNKFTFDNDHVIPFQMVHESLPDISRLSLCPPVDQSDTSLIKRQCPKNTFAIEISPDITDESCEAMTIALGSRRKTIWYTGIEQAEYWSNNK